MVKICNLIVLSIVMFGAALLIRAFRRIRDLKAQNRNLLAKKEQTRRNFNSFLHQLASEQKIEDAMNTIASQICEELDAESVGIFMQDFSMDNTEGKEVFKGISCTSLFPILTGNVLEESNRHVFGGLTERMEYFRKETFNLENSSLLSIVCRDRKAILLNNGDELLASCSVPSTVYSIMLFPLVSEDRFSGIVCAVNRGRSERGFQEADLEKFRELAYSVSLASSLVSIYAERENQNRLQSEVAFGARFQQALLPEIPPRVCDLNVAAVSIPCREVSGDFYDYMEISEDVVMIMVADATGKGIPACMLTSMCRSFARSLVERYTNLEQFMLDMNRLVNDNSDPSLYLTANVIVIDRTSYRCKIACAGHPPFLVANPDGSVTAIRPDGPALGLFPNCDAISFSTQMLELLPGMKLCIFTDGLSEALNADNEEFNEERLTACWKEAAAKNLPAKDTIREIMEKLNEFVGGTHQSDDQTILVIQRDSAE